MSENIFNNLRDFVVKQSCVDDGLITIETRIEDDLGVYGDDAVEFMIAYGKEFNVDVSNFMAADYFDGEGGLKLFPFIKHIFGIKGTSTSRKTLTVGHLEKGIIAGRLDEEVINS